MNREVGPVRQVTPSVCSLGESPIWDAANGCLYWIDIEESKVWRFDVDGESARELAVAPGIGALTLEADGRLVAYERDGEVRLLGAETPPIQVPSVAGTRFNDAVCDRAGRVYAGVMPVAGQPGQLLRLEADRVPVQIADPLLPNGAGFSLDGTTLYFTDSLRRAIHAAPFDERTGTIGRARVFTRVPRDAGTPDGMAIDREGGIWSARHGGAVVVRYDANGAESVRVPIPCTRPTGIAFGGPELRDLYIATARVDGEPASGALFCVEVGVVGAPAERSRLFG